MLSLEGKDQKNQIGQGIRVPAWDRSQGYHHVAHTYRTEAAAPSFFYLENPGKPDFSPKSIHKK